MVINDRINQLIRVLDENPNSFAEQIGVKGAVVYNIIRGRRNKPSFEVLSKILEAFLEVNTEWLLRGEGEILDYAKKSVSSKEKKAKAPNKSLRVSVERRAIEILGDLGTEHPNSPEIDELSELFFHLIKENESQKIKMLDLYEKNEKIQEVLRQKMGLEI